jgi:hypothetical protein
MVMVFNVTYHTISVISWRSALMVKGTWVPRENHRPVTSHTQTLSHNVVSSKPLHHDFHINIFAKWYEIIQYMVIIIPHKAWYKIVPTYKLFSSLLTCRKTACLDMCCVRGQIIWFRLLIPLWCLQTFRWQNQKK